MFNVRLATIEDLDQIVDLRMEFLREEQPEAVDLEIEARDKVREYVADKLPKGEFMVWFAEVDDRIVGTGGLIFFHRPPTLRNTSELNAYILNMYTVSEWRGKGVATMLLQHIIEYVKTTPAKRISLHASEMGRSIYEKFGFVASSGGMTLSL